MEADRERVIIYPGSFDPVHYGHIALARFVTSDLFPGGAARLWWLPSRRNPLKQDAPRATDDQRATMLRLAAGELDGVEVCTVEYELPEPSFTIDTLRHLKSVNPSLDFSLLIGSDNWLTFHHWKEYREVLGTFGVYIYPRPGYTADPSAIPPGAVWLSDAPQSPISSTLIRRRLADDQSIGTLTTPAVREYIRLHHIY